MNDIEAIYGGFILDYKAPLFHIKILFAGIAWNVSHERKKTRWPGGA